MLDWNNYTPVTLPSNWQPIGPFIRTVSEKGKVVGFFKAVDARLGTASGWQVRVEGTGEIYTAGTKNSDGTYQVTLMGDGDKLPIQGAGSPEGVVTAAPGQLYVRTDTGQVYRKRYPAGKTGWEDLTDRNMPITPHVRDRPLSDGGTQPVRALAADPAVPNRVWFIGGRFSQFGYSDDNGTTFTPKSVNPASPQGVQSLYFGPNYAWLTTTYRVYRSPLPAADGSGLNWTLMFDLQAPPSGITVGANAFFRNQCLAVSGTRVALIEYGAGAVTGGPSLYLSEDSGATWAKTYTWSNPLSKHLHAVRWITAKDGKDYLWVTAGDGGSAYPAIGLWAATVATPTQTSQWSQKNLLPGNGGNEYYGINAHPFTLAGRKGILQEYDGEYNVGPLWFPSQEPTAASSAMQALCRMPAPYRGTMRQMTIDPKDGTIYWVHTGEGGAVGPRDTLWALRGPLYDTPILLEDMYNAASDVPIGSPAGTAAISNPLATLGDPVQTSTHFWIGNERVKKPVWPN